jgi:hypothetical protein
MVHQPKLSLIFIIILNRVAVFKNRRAGAEPGLESDAGKKGEDGFFRFPFRRLVSEGQASSGSRVNESTWRVAVFISRRWPELPLL